MLIRQKRYQLSSDYLLREIAGEGVLVPIGRAPGNTMTTLNKTSVFLFRLLETPHTVEEIIALAQQRYNDPSGVLDAQIREFISNHLQTGKLKEA